MSVALLRFKTHSVCIMRHGRLPYAQGIGLGNIVRSFIALVIVMILCSVCYIIFQLYCMSPHLSLSFFMEVMEQRNINTSSPTNTYLAHCFLAGHALTCSGQPLWQVLENIYRNKVFLQCLGSVLSGLFCLALWLSQRQSVNHMLLCSRF